MEPTQYVTIRACDLPADVGASARPIIQYRCEICGSFHHAEHLAVMCCNPYCPECGALRPEMAGRHFRPFNAGLCTHCREKLFNERLVEKLRHCTIIEKPTTNFIFHHSLPGNTYLDLSDYEECGWLLVEIVDDVCRNARKPVETPCYVFDCDAEHWDGLKLDDIIDNELEEWFEDAADHLQGVDELQQAVNAFNAKQHLTQFVASDRIIVLDPVRFKALIGINE